MQDLTSPHAPSPSIPLHDKTPLDPLDHKTTEAHRTCLRHVGDVDRGATVPLP